MGKKVRSKVRMTEKGKRKRLRREGKKRTSHKVKNEAIRVSLFSAFVYYHPSLSLVLPCPDADHIASLKREMRDLLLTFGKKHETG